MDDGSAWASSSERFALAQVYHDVAAVIGWDAAIEFGMAVWEQKRPPSRAKTNSVHGGGRGVIYIPRSLAQARSSHLVRLAGKDGAARLSAAFGGLYLEFPCVIAASVRRRNRAITEQIEAGARTQAVAGVFDLTPQHVRRIHRQGNSR